MDGAIDYEYYVNRGLSEDGMQSTDERFEKTQERSVQLSIGDTVEVYACGENEQRSSMSMITYYLSEDDSSVVSAINNWGDKCNDLEWAQYNIDNYNSKMTQLKVDFESAYAAATTDEDRSSVFAEYAHKASDYYYYYKGILEEGFQPQLLSAANEVEKLMETTVIYTHYSKLQLKDLRAEIASYKAKVETLQTSYEGRMSVSYLYVVAESLVGERKPEGVFLLFSALDESTSLENVGGTVRGYLPDRYEIIKDFEGVSTYDLSIGYQPTDNVNTVNIVYTPDTYTVTYDMGAFSGKTTCIASTEAKTTEKVSLPVPYCNELFFDCWEDENGNTFSEGKMYFDYGEDITLTAKWKNNISYDEVFGNSEKTIKNADGTSIVAFCGFVEAVFGENENRYFYVREQYIAHGYLVRNPLIRAYEDAKWMGNATNAETEAFFYDENSLLKELYGVDNKDGQLYFNSCYVYVQGLLVTNDGRMELQDAKIIKTPRTVMGHGSTIMGYAVDHTEDFATCTDYKSLKGLQNSIVTLQGCTVSTKEGKQIVSIEGGNLDYKFTTATMEEQNVSTDWVKDALVFDTSVTLRVIVRYYEDKNGNAEIWLEPAPEDLFIKVENS